MNSILFIVLCLEATRAFWDNSKCHLQKAVSLKGLDAATLRTVTPECFSRLQNVSRANLAKVLPHLAENILSFYTKGFHKKTAEAISGDQFFYYSAQVEGKPCRTLSLECFSSPAVARISARCLKGVLSSKFKYSNLAYLHRKAPNVLTLALSNEAICEGFEFIDLINVSHTLLGAIGPQCFANLRDSPSRDFSPWLPQLRKDIFANYNFSLHPHTINALTPAHMIHFASDRPQKMICNFLNFETATRETIAQLSKPCILGALSGMFRSKNIVLMRHISQDSFEYLMSNPTNICANLSAESLIQAPVSYSPLWDSACIALMSEIEITTFGDRLNHSPNNIFQYYNGNLSELDLANLSPEKMAYFGSKVGKLRCSKLDLSKVNDEALISVPPDCLVNFVRLSGCYLDPQRWKNLFEIDDFITEKVFFDLIEVTNAENWVRFPIGKHWDVWFSKSVKNSFSALFSEHVPKVFFDRISKQKSAVIWWLSALKFRSLNDYGMIKMVTELVEQYPETSRRDIFDYLFSSNQWFCRLLAFTFVKDQELGSFLTSTTPPSWTPKIIPLVMVNGVFDFKTSYDYVVNNSDNILHQDARLQTDRYIDQGGPMRQWVDQMLEYISAYKLLEITATGQVCFPFFADPSVGIFVGAVYAKAFQLKIKPPLNILSILDMISSKTHLEQSKSAPIQFYSTIRDDRSKEEFDLALESYQFIEPEEMETWHPVLRPRLDILPDTLPLSSPTKIYTNDSLCSDFLVRFADRCSSECCRLFNGFYRTIPKGFNITAYFALLKRECAQGYVGKTMLVPELIVAAVQWEANLGSTRIASLINPDVKITFEDAFTSIIHALRERERSRFLAIVTGSKHVDLQRLELYIAERNESYSLSSQHAYGEDKFIKLADYTEILQRARTFQKSQRKRKVMEKDTQDTEFRLASVVSCIPEIQFYIQSSHGILFSILHLLNEDPSNIDDGAVAISQSNEN